MTKRTRTSELDQRVAALVAAAGRKPARVIPLEALDAKQLRLLELLEIRNRETAKILAGLMSTTLDSIAALYDLSPGEQARVSLAPDVHGSDVIVCFPAELPPSPEALPEKAPPEEPEEPPTEGWSEE